MNLETNCASKSGVKNLAKGLKEISVHLNIEKKRQEKLPKLSYHRLMSHTSIGYFLKLYRTD